jgi:hypothetical protein
MISYSDIVGSWGGDARAGRSVGDRCVMELFFEIAG